MPEGPEIRREADAIAGALLGQPLREVYFEPTRLRKDGNISAVAETLVADDSVDVIGLVLGMRGDGWDSHQGLVDRLAQAARGAAKPLMVVSFMLFPLLGQRR